MMNGLFSFLGIDTDVLEGNGVDDGEARLEKGDVNTAELVSSGAATPEQATLLNGLLGQVMEMDAPVDPGKTFNDYLGDQGGFKGFMGDVVGEPILNNLFFGDDKDAYDDAVAGYQMDKKKYDSLWEIATAGKVQQAKNDATDAQNDALSDWLEAVAAGDEDWNTLIYQALAGRAGGYDKVDPDLKSVPQGTVMLDSRGEVAFSNPRAPDLTTAQRNTKQWEEYNPEPPKGTPEHDAWTQARNTFFGSGVRALQNINGTQFSGTGGGVIGDETVYTDNTSRQAQAEVDGTRSAEYQFDTFEDAANTYRTAWEQKDIINERIANVDRAIEMFDPDNPNALDTGLVRGGIYKVFGIGPEGMATIEAMSVEETINWLMNFKGPTTDFEFDRSSATAFADIMKGGKVNAEKLAQVKRTLEKVARLNNSKAEAAYGTLQDYSGEEGQPGDRTKDIASINKNYSPWFEQEGSQEGIIDGVPTFARFSADMEKRASDSGTEMSAEDIRALYNKHYPTPRK